MAPRRCRAEGLDASVFIYLLVAALALSAGVVLGVQSWSLSDLASPSRIASRDVSCWCSRLGRTHVNSKSAVPAGAVSLVIGGLLIFVWPLVDNTTFAGYVSIVLSQVAGDVLLLIGTTYPSPRGPRWPDGSCWPREPLWLFSGGHGSSISASSSRSRSGGGPLLRPWCSAVLHFGVDGLPVLSLYSCPGAGIGV